MNAIQTIKFIEIDITEFPPGFYTWLKGTNVATYKDQVATGEDLFREELLSDLKAIGVETPADYLPIIEEIEDLLAYHDATYFRVVHN